MPFEVSAWGVDIAVAGSQKGFMLPAGLLLMAASWGLVLTKGLNLGVDFIGGQMIRVTFEHSATAPVAVLRGEVEKLGFGEPVIQQFGQPNQISIRMKLPHGSEGNAGLADAMARRITTEIKAKHADARVDGVDSVSGKVSKELGWTAFQALGFAAGYWAVFVTIASEQFGTNIRATATTTSIFISCTTAAAQTLAWALAVKADFGIAPAIVASPIT